MKYVVIGLLLVSTSSYAIDKFRKYKFNQDVEVIISTMSCPFKHLKEYYPLTAVANRIDGQRLFGCYIHKNSDIIIQWDGGDKIYLPANNFLEY